MTIAEQLTQDLAESMKAGTSERTGVLRLLRGSLKNEQIKTGHELDDAESLKVLQREAKQRRDSILAYNEAGRTDLAENEAMEQAIIAGYLPQPLSEIELSSIVEGVISETGATDMKSMGAVIGAVMGKVGARAEGGAVSKIVREKLS